MVFVLGQNPSKHGLRNIPFVGTKSWERLERILDLADVRKYCLLNATPVYGKVTIKDVNIDDLRMKLEPADVIIAVGRLAEAAAEKAAPKTPCLYIPHTSGRSRYYNRPDAEQYISEYIIHFIKNGGWAWRLQLLKKS